MLITRKWSVGWLVEYGAWLDYSWILLVAGDGVLISAGQNPLTSLFVNSPLVASSKVNMFTGMTLPGRLLLL